MSNMIKLKKYIKISTIYGSIYRYSAVGLLILSIIIPTLRNHMITVFSLIIGIYMLIYLIKHIYFKSVHFERKIEYQHLERLKAVPTHFIIEKLLILRFFRRYCYSSYCFPATFISFVEGKRAYFIKQIEPNMKISHFQVVSTYLEFIILKDENGRKFMGHIDQFA